MISDTLSSDTDLKVLFTRWPAAIPVFMRYRMSCVGCCMAGFDTLDDAVVNYHLEMSSFLSDLQAAIRKGQALETQNPA